MDLTTSLNRRQFLTGSTAFTGSVALSQLLGAEAARRVPHDPVGALPGLPHFAPKAKRVIYLHMVGAPSQLETFDHKPGMQDWFDKDLPESIRAGQRLTSMTSGQGRFPIAPSLFKFHRAGKRGTWISELLPNLAKVADDITIIRSMHTEAINHDPAITFVQTGAQIAGRACMGSWASYGLGSMNENLPRFVVLLASHSSKKANVQAISAKMWSSGFLPGEHAGVALRQGADPVLYLQNPEGMDRSTRRRYLDALGEMNQLTASRLGDPETLTRISQYEMAFRMQSSVPELTDISKEPQSTFDLYGEDARQGGTFAHGCLLARRMAERGVRFVQLYQRGWDHHFVLPAAMPDQCRDVDRGMYGLITDLKQRGLLEDTLVVWGGEFGRTIYSQGRLTKDNYGRDHHPKCFSLWLAGGGIKAGHDHGETDEFSYNITRDPVHVRDLHATLLHQLGIQHDRFTFKSQGLDFRLTGVEHARVVKEILA